MRTGLWKNKQEISTRCLSSSTYIHVPHFVWGTPCSIWRACRGPQRFSKLLGYFALYLWPRRGVSEDCLPQNVLLSPPHRVQSRFLIHLAWNFNCCQNDSWMDIISRYCCCWCFFKKLIITVSYPPPTPMDSKPGANEKFWSPLLFFFFRLVKPMGKYNLPSKVRNVEEWTEPFYRKFFAMIWLGKVTKVS